MMQIEKTPLQQERLEIYTLGRFLVKRDNKVISECWRTSKPWLLFKYFLTHRGKNILPESALENLWPQQQYTDPRRAFRSLVFRLRNLLSPNCSSFFDSYISFSHGCYHWNTELDYWFDAEEFEHLCQKAHQVAKVEPLEAIKLYEDALELYKGEYLPECSYMEWSIPIKNYYNRLYLQSVLELITLLHENKCYNKIIEICEKAFLIEPWEEELHLKFMEALLEKGKTRQALAHYNYITAALYNELGIKPSAALQKIYNLIKKGWQSAPLVLKSIQKNLAKNYAGTGSYYCDPELFQEVLKLEQLRNERTGQQSSLALLSLTAKEFNNISSHTQLEAMNKIQSILLKNLRKGDVFTRWNDFQFLVILSNTNLNQSHVPLQRISRNFKKDRPTSNIALQESVQSILPLQLPV